HILGNHSYEHGFFFDLKRTAAMVAEIEKTNTRIQEITGKRPLLFRPPYGVTNPNLATAVRKTGMVSIGWSLRSLDTRAQNKEQLLRKMLDKSRGGDIILLHDSMKITREILTEFIKRSRQKGFTFVSLDKML